MTKKHDKQADMMAEKGYLRAADVARKIGRSVTSIYALVRTGEVKGMRVGRAWYVERASMVQWLGPEAARTFEV